MPLAAIFVKCHQLSYGENIKLAQNAWSLPSEVWSGVFEKLNGYLMKSIDVLGSK